MAIKIILETRHYTLNDGDDPSVEWGNRDTDVTELESVYASLTGDTAEPGRYWGSREVATFNLDAGTGDTVYAVIAQYSTGDTFGRSEGLVSVMDAFSDLDEAKNLVEQLTRKPDKKDKGRITEFERTVNGKKYYLPWVGYFEHLDMLRVHAVTVGGERDESVTYW